MFYVTISNNKDKSLYKPMITSCALLYCHSLKQCLETSTLFLQAYRRLALTPAIFKCHKHLQTIHLTVSKQHFNRMLTDKSNSFQMVLLNQLQKNKTILSNGIVKGKTCLILLQLTTLWTSDKILHSKSFLFNLQSYNSILIILLAISKS